MVFKWYLKVVHHILEIIDGKQKLYLMQDLCLYGCMLRIDVTHKVGTGYGAVGYLCL